MPPVGLDRCVKLRSLDLSFNALQTAEGLPPLPDLRELKLYCNRLVSISGLTKLPSLTTLLLQSNRLQPPDLSAPPPLSLSGLPNLSFLRIDSNPALGDTGVAALCLAGLPKLTELDASGTGLTSLEAMRGLAPTLETLRLDRNGLGRVPIRGASACSSMGGGGGACGGGNAGGSDALARVPARGASACSEERGGGASGGGGGACRGGGGTGGSSLASSPDAGGGGQTGVGVKGRGVAEGGKAGGGVAGSSVAGSPLCAPLLAISSLKGLTDLHLGWNALHDDSLAAMRGVALTLTCLKLNDNRLATLHALPALPALTELDLARNLISALGAFGMAEIPAGGGKGAGGREAAAVPAGGGSRGGRGSAGARGRAPMALAGNPPSRLRPGAPPVGIATAKAAGSGDAGGGGGEARPSCPPFPCLQVLDLSHNQLLLTCTAGGETLRPLRRAALPALCELSLAGNPGALGKKSECAGRETRVRLAGNAGVLGGNPRH
jgi:Leucine-rich repeat (LRR) protein